MSRAESFLTGVVQVAGPLQSVQENVVAVKLHPDAVSLMQPEPTLTNGNWIELSPGL